MKWVGLVDIMRVH